jgi:hypothetical protein
MIPEINNPRTRFSGEAEPGLSVRLNLTHRILYDPGPFQKLKFFHFFSCFLQLPRSNTHAKPLLPFMRQLRKLGQGVWYEIRTRINNREPLFRRAKALTIFARVFRETMLRFVLRIRGLRVEDDWLTFYIKPEDGFELPKIMKWMKQVFA